MLTPGISRILFGFSAREFNSTYIRSRESSPITGWSYWLSSAYLQNFEMNHPCWPQAFGQLC